MVHIVLNVSARDLVHADLASCGWSGSAHHLAGVSEQLERVLLSELGSSTNDWATSQSAVSLIRGMSKPLTDLCTATKRCAR